VDAKAQVEYWRGQRYIALTTTNPDDKKRKPLLHQAALVRIKGEDEMATLINEFARAEVQRQLLYLGLGHELPMTLAVA
jgi:hypothetical protein